MNIFRSELRKLSGHKFFWLFCIFLFFLNIWTLFEKMKMEWFSPESTKAIYQEISAIPEGEQEEWLREKKDNIGKEKSYSVNLFTEEHLFKKLTNDLQQITNYENYLDEMQEKAARMTSIIFSNSQSFAYRSARKTPAIFEDLKGLELKIEVSEGVILATKAEFTDLCIILTITALSYFLVYHEKKYKLYGLLKTTYKGRKSIISAKLLTAGCITLFCVLLYYGSNYIIGYYKYGFGNLTRPIQSVTMLYESPFRLSVGGYLVLYMLIKFIVCFAIVLLVMVLAQVMKSSVGVLGVSIIIGLAEYALSVFVPGNSDFDLLKYMNLAEYIKVYPLMSRYQNLNFFDYPLNAVYVFVIFTILMVVLLWLANCRKFRQTPNVKAQQEGGYTKLSKRISITSANLFPHELYKLCVVYKAFWFGCALVVAGVFLSRGSIGYPDSTESVYRSYMLDQEGDLTGEKLQYFEKKNEEYKKILQMTTENSELSEFEIEVKKSNLMYTYDGFMKAYSQVQYVKDWNMNNPKERLQLVYETGYEILLGERNPLYSGSLILLGVIAAIYISSVTLGGEYDLQVMNLLRSARKGRLSLLINKVWSVYLLVFVTAVLARIPMLWKINKQYPMGQWGARIQSIQAATQTTGNHTIIGYLILVLAGQLLALLVLVLAVMALSMWVKDTIMTIVIATSLFVLPLILQWSGFATIHYFTLNGLLETHRLLQSSSGTLVRYVITFLIILPCICIWRFQRTCKGSR